ncbi:hypothetical protein [Halomontanus rarus]|uniref:hypothetical protein n=1 Tax=Halomontanus rarus TaxID=3034020 RepID=UPI0023E84EFB|nr:hypothetical protein [Halovivax sp. TS33]
MMIRGKDVAMSMLAVGTAAIAGYVLRNGQSRTSHARSKADVGARIISETEVPADATVVDVSSRRLRELPGARRAIKRAVSNDAREEWEHVTLETNGAWEVVDGIRRSLPYHDGDDGEYNGVYVRYGSSIVVLDAIGWAHVEEPLY